MAFRRSSTRRSVRRAPARRRSPASSYRSRAVRRPARRRASTGRGQTIRIEVVQAPSNGVSRPEIGMKAAQSPRKAAF